MTEGQENSAAERAVQELRTGGHVKVQRFCGTKKVRHVHDLTQTARVLLPSSQPGIHCKLYLVAIIWQVDVT